MPSRAFFGRREALAITLLMPPSFVSASPPGIPVEAERLYATARIWTTKHRDDLALEAITKALVVAPGNPVLLADDVSIELRLGHIAAARVALARLQATAATSPAARQAADEVRIATGDRQAMATVRLLARSGRIDEAAQRLVALFPRGAPSGRLGVEYQRIVGGTPKGRPGAVQALRDTLADDPDDVDAQLALAGLLNEAETRAEANRLAQNLAMRTDTDHAIAMDMWRRVLKAAGTDPAYRAALRAYLRLVPDDTQMAQHLAALETQRAVTESADLVVQQRGKAQARTAHYRGWLARGREAAAAGQPQQAEAAARKALALRRESVDARVLLADALLAQEKDQQAEALLRELLDGPSATMSSLRGMIAVYQHTGRADETDGLMESMQARFAATPEHDEFTRIRSDLLGRQAATLRAAGNTAEALKRYEAQLRLTPDDPWTRFTVAKLYRDTGSPGNGRKVMDDGLDVSDDPAMHFATALFRSSLDDVRGAQAALAPVPEGVRTEGMRALAQRLDVRQALARARRARASGDQPRAARILAAAAVRADSDGQLVASIGAAWIDNGTPDRGVALLHDWMDAHPERVDTDLRLRYGDLLGSAHRDDELAALLGSVRRDPSLDDTQRTRLEDQALRLALRETDAALERRDYAGARARLARVDPAGQADKRYALERADVARAEGDFTAARMALEPLLAKAPDDAQVQLGLARVLEQGGARAQALAIVRRVLQAQPDDLDIRLAAVRRLSAMQRLEEADKVTVALRTAYPDEPAVTVQAGRIAQNLGRFDEAATLYRQSITQEVAAGLGSGRDATPGQAALDNLAQRRNPEVETAWLSAFKSGDPGISDYHAQQVPVYVQFPYHYDGHFFAHVDAVHLDAGTLANPDVSSYTRNTFGTFAARNEATPLATSVSQHATGVALGTGYESDVWRVDLGTTPLGFPVHYLVGGIRYRMATDDASLTVNVSRRPETSSELTYAGARDPVTGAVWGGVRRDGIDLHGSIDFGAVNVFASLGGGVLTGRNVKANEEVVLRAGFDVPIYARADTKVSTGLIGNAWHYADNLRFYTYGQGGYYSPQRYLSLGVPLEWIGRRDALTWDLQATVGISWTYEKDSPYFPVGLPASPNLGPVVNKVFSGGRGGGFSYALGSTVQYRFSPKVVGGVRVNIEHSHDYAPSAAMLFVRYAFDARKEDDSLSPHPVRLYSGY